MTTTTHLLGHLTPEADALAAHRASYVAGLRDLAAFLEAHGEVPVPTRDTLGTHPWNWSGPRTAATFTAAASSLGLVRQRDCGGPLEEVLAERAFGPLRYTIAVEASVVTTARPVQTVQRVLPAELLKLAEGGEAGEDPAGNWSLAECGVGDAEATA